MKYQLTNGKRWEESNYPVTKTHEHYDEVLEEARAWVACTDADVSVFVPGEKSPVFTVERETGRTK